MFARTITTLLLAALRDTPVVLLLGARQTGKSTLVRWLAKDAHPAEYISMDNPAALAAATGSPDDFIAGLRGPVIIDEVQLAPDLFRAIKLSVDQDRRPGRFLLTGSANVLLAPKISESLAGRMEILTLWPLSQGEFSGHQEGFVDALFDAAGPPVTPVVTITRDQLAQKIIAGGYPEASQRLQPDRREAWFNSYIQTILERDVRHLAAIEGLTQLPRLFALLAGYTGCLLNIAELSRDLGFTQPTLARYLMLLQATHLYHPLPAWFVNTRKRLIKREKVYLNDTGLVCYLKKVVADRFADPAENIGPLLESFVFQELYKQAGFSRTKPGIYYYRTNSGREVDFVLENRAGALVGVEVKASLSLCQADFRGLRDLAETAGHRFIRGVVLYLGENILPFGKNIFALPISALWSIGATTFGVKI